MTPISYRYCHFPPVVIQHAVWLYARFTLSFRDIEELLAERGKRAALTLMCSLLKNTGMAPHTVVTHKLRS